MAWGSLCCRTYSELGVFCRASLRGPEAACLVFMSLILTLKLHQAYPSFTHGLYASYPAIRELFVITAAWPPYLKLPLSLGFPRAMHCCGPLFLGPS